MKTIFKNKLRRGSTNGTLPLQSVQGKPKYTFAVAKDQSPILSQLQFIGLTCCGLLSCLGYLQIYRLGDLREKVPEFLFCYFLLAIIYFISFTIASRNEEESRLRVSIQEAPRSRPDKDISIRSAQHGKSRIVKTIIFFALLFRAVLFFSPPSLSDDVFRYAWEGYVQLKGFNPYQVAPESDLLRDYRNAIWEKVNNKEVPAIYPPLMQLFSLLTFFVFRSVWGFKLVFIALDLWVLRTLGHLLQANKKSLAQIIVYAWNPLVVVEIAGSGHYDVLVAGLLLQSLWLYQRNQHNRSLLALGASILCKFYHLLAIPLFLRKIPARKFWLLPLVLLTGYLPYLLAGPHLFGALFNYRQKWRFNGFSYQWLSSMLQSEAQAEAVLLSLLLSILAVSLWSRKGLIEQCYWVTGAIIFCTPTLFPWYLLWIVPFLCFFPNPAWLLLTTTIGLSYYVLTDWWILGIWRQNQTLMALEYLPFYGMMVWSIFKRFRDKRV